MNIFQGVIVPDFARQRQTDQDNPAPVPFVQKYASGEQKRLYIDKANDRDLVFHFAGYCNILAVVCYVFLRWHWDELILIKDQVVVFHTHIEVA